MNPPGDDTQARLAAQLKELRLAAGLGGVEAGQRVKELRLAAGTGGVEAAPPAGISQSKISKLERGLLRPAPDDVRTLCEVYGAPPQLRDELVRLAETLRTDIIEPPRITLSRGAAFFQQRIRRLEESATLLRSWQPCMVIGLLQTPAYARLVFGAAVSGPDVDEAVTARLQRQATLRDQVPRAVLLMSEGALRWQAGSPEVMLEQIAAISAAIDLPNVDVGIIPFSAPATFFPRHGFHLYDSDAVIVGTESGTATITDGVDVARYEKMFAQLEAIASMGAAARLVLDRIASDYRDL